MSGSQQDLFASLLDEHRRILYKVAGTYARSVEDRQDLVQEMVVQLWQNLPSHFPANRGRG